MAKGSLKKKLQVVLADSSLCHTEKFIFSLIRNRMKMFQEYRYQKEKTSAV